MSVARVAKSSCFVAAAMWRVVLRGGAQPGAVVWAETPKPISITGMKYAAQVYQAVALNKHRKKLMARKPPSEERRIILANDQRRRYGTRIVFRVLHALHIGTLADVTFLLPDGTCGHIRPRSSRSSEVGVAYELDIEAFPSAAEAEQAGMRAAQALLLTAISLDFGIRLDYTGHEPPTVFDRTVSPGMTTSVEAITSWPEEVIIQELTDDFQQDLRDRRVLLSMELLAASTLESNDRARFVMAVSALEPLAVQLSLGDEVGQFVARALADLRAAPAIPQSLRASLEGRVRQLQTESVRQALSRLCARWFPGDATAREDIDHVYALRSEILHNGRVSDLDTLLGAETRNVRQYLRRIYEQEFVRKFRVVTGL